LGNNNSRLSSQVAAFLLAFKGIENVAHNSQGGTIHVSEAFTNPIFRNIVLSLLATLGLYILASVIFVSAFRISTEMGVIDLVVVVRTMAHDHVFHSVPSHGPILYQRAQCLRRKLFSLSLSLYSIDDLPVAIQFANVHDVSWGTKGDNKVSTDLGVVATGKNKNEVEVTVPTAETDINAAYEDAIHVLSTKPPKAEQKPDPGTQQEDYYRTFRTK
jgi:chitin synthase